MKRAVVISLGGSVIAPRGVDTRFLRQFARMVRSLQRRGFRVATICGGGNLSRTYVQVARRVGVADENVLHWIGIRSCRLNAELLRAVLGVRAPLATEFDRHPLPRGGIIVAAPWKPGSTSDLGSVLLAKRLGARTVFNITNVAGVYTADPFRNRNARLLPVLTWKAFLGMSPGHVRPGIHVPFDPIAGRAAARNRFRVIVLSKDLRNLQNAIVGKPFRGTRIGPT